MVGGALGSVVGMGVDVVEIGRIERAMRRSAFLERCFTARERAYAGPGVHAAQRLAARFAAKEAAIKALGLGGGLSRFTDIEVERERGGGVTLAFNGKARERFLELGGTKTHLSFSHGRDIAVAVVVIER